MQELTEFLYMTDVPEFEDTDLELLLMSETDLNEYSTVASITTFDGLADEC